MLQQNHFPHNQLTHNNLAPLPNKQHHHSLFFNPKAPCANHQLPAQLSNPQNFLGVYNKTKNPTEEEGFAFDHDDESGITILNKQHPNIHMIGSVSTSKKFVPYRIKQPKIKLTFISKQKQPEPLSLTLKKEYQNKSMQIKKVLNSQSVIINPQKLIANCVIKIKRNFVADNISYHNYSSDENKRIKFEIISMGHKIIYELLRQNSTYAHLTLLRQNCSNRNCNSADGIRKNCLQSNKGVNQKTKKQKMQKTTSELGQTVQYLSKTPSPCILEKQQQFFLDSPLNQLLKSKLKQSFIYHKRREPKKNQTDQIQFESQFQSGNLQFASRVNHSAQQKVSFPLAGKQQNSQTKDSQSNQIPEYNLYLRNDTNTHGHQNWFYFRVKNLSQQKKRVRLNIVNLKRNLNLIKQGQKVYARTISPIKSDWFIVDENIEIKQNKTTTVYRCKVRIMCFEFQIDSNTQYEISLLPPYTYSEILSDIEELKLTKFVKVQTLTYSLVGLAIPIVTFTNPEIEDTNKQVILISSRIHPGETVASFIVKGIFRYLSNPKDSVEVEDLLNTTIIKIIPVINPDGVVFGNFRTNYLGYDLNRSFHSQDEITNPEILALKQLGRKLKSIHNEKFHTFIDLHGHSSQKNIFTYGPDFQNGHQNFYKARLLPKLLNSKSPYFKYSSCTFKLEEYKSNTARAFFLSLGVTSFTIESSYAIYESQAGKNEVLTPIQWLNFGQTLGDSISTISRLSKTHTIKDRTTLKRVIQLTEDDNLQLLNTLKKEMKKQQTSKKTRKLFIDKGYQDSDGQDENQDLNANERQDIQKKLIENTEKNFLLPKVFKPSILYPTATPKIFNIGQTSVSGYKILYTRRNRYQSIKLPASSYLHSLQGMESLKPKARNIKIQQKMII